MGWPMFRKRPGSLTFLAIANLIVGSCGLLLILLSSLIHLVSIDNSNVQLDGPFGPNYVPFSIGISIVPSRFVQV